MLEVAGIVILKQSRRAKAPEWGSHQAVYGTKYAFIPRAARRCVRGIEADRKKVASHHQGAKAPIVVSYSILSILQMFLAVRGAFRYFLLQIKMSE